MVTESLSLEILKRIPKAELHCHLDGSVRPATVWELAKKNGVDLPVNSMDELREIMKVRDDCESLVEYLRCFSISLSVMQDSESITRIMYEVAEDASADGVRYLEVRFSPMLHTQKGLELSSIMEAVCEGIYLAEYHLPITVRIIVCGMRHESDEQSRAMAEIAWRYKDKGVCAFDLAGPENGFPSRDHKEAFRIVRNKNVNVTIHAGEAAGPNSIRDAIRYCGAHRIGHGTRLREDPYLFQYVLDARIPLEMCPTSNLHTKCVTSLQDHPFADYLRAGLIVVPCTDNRTVSDINLSEEYFKMQQLFNLTPLEILRIVDNGFRAGFIDASFKKNMRVAAVNETLNIFREMGIDVTDMVNNYAIPMLGDGWTVSRLGLTTPRLGVSPSNKNLNHQKGFNKELVHNLKKVDNHIRLDRALSEDVFMKLATDLLEMLPTYKKQMKEYIATHENPTYAIRKTSKFEKMVKCLENAVEMNPGEEKTFSLEKVHELFTISENTQQAYKLAKCCITVVLQTEEALRLGVKDLVEQANKENVVYMEIHVRPAVHTYLGLQRESVVEIMLDELKKQREEFPDVVTNLVIGCSVKEDDPVEFFETAQLAVQNRYNVDDISEMNSFEQWTPAVVAFSFHGGDVNEEAANHLIRTINYLKDKSFPMAVSCGRSSVESISLAIHQIGANRLSGCYSLHQEPELMDYIASHKLNVEIAETEHFRRHSEGLSAFTRSFYRLLIDNHVSLSLVSISPIFRSYSHEKRTTMTDILMNTTEQGFTPAHLLHAMISGVQSSFLPYQIRSSLKNIVRRSAHEQFNAAGIQFDGLKHFHPPSVTVRNSTSSMQCLTPDFSLTDDVTVVINPEVIQEKPLSDN